MKKFAFLILLAAGNASASMIQLTGAGAPAAAGGATPALVQSSCSASINTTTLTLTLTGVTVGNTLSGLYVDSGDAFVSISDGANTYTNRSSGGSGNGSARAIIYASTNVATGGTRAMVVTAAAPAVLNGCVAEFSGVTTYDIFKTAGATGTNPTSGNFTTTGGTDLCMGIMSHSTGGTALTPGGTQIGEDEDNTTHQTYNAQYKTVSAGTNSLTWTSSSVAYVIDTVCFK